MPSNDQRKAVLAAVLAAAVLFAAAPAPAAETPAGPSARLQGTIGAFDGHTLAVKTADGRDVTVTVPPGTGIVAHARRTLADIKPGDFVGSAASPGKDGALMAREVHIFPEAMRGRGEGQRPMDIAPDTSMTNATVTEVVGTRGNTLKLKFPQGEATIVVGPQTPVFALVPADAKALKPGAAVSITAGKAADGALSARYLAVEMNGVKPFM